MEKKPSPSTPSLKWSVLFFLCILVLWQLLLPVLEIPSYLLPTPLAILAEFQKRGGFIFANFLPTFYETILGFSGGEARAGARRAAARPRGRCDRPGRRARARPASAPGSGRRRAPRSGVWPPARPTDRARPRGR